MRRPSTLWSPAGTPDRVMFDYTAGDDRAWDARLLRWDVLGSLGHVEGLRASRLLTATEHARLRAGLRAALVEVEAGRLRVSPRQEDVHTAIEAWLTRRLPGVGERLHTGRSRNDQVATDLGAEREIASGHLEAANFLGLAEVKLQRGDIAAAIAILNRMTLVVEDGFETLPPAAELLGKYGKTAEAADFLRKRIRAVPWDARAGVHQAGRRSERHHRHG